MHTTTQRVQDQILLWCKEERWDRIAAEKRSVLGCMSQVLESCYTLLDSTQIPVDGIVRLLQHILRPQQQELQMWASQLLLGADAAVHGLGVVLVWAYADMHVCNGARGAHEGCQRHSLVPPLFNPPLAGKGMTLEDLQKKFETQAAVAELLKMLRPNGSGSGEGAVASGSLAGSSAAAAAAAVLLRSHVLPQQLHQKLLQQQAQAQAQLPPPLQPAASAAAAASIPAAQGVALPAVSPPPPAAAATATPSSTEQRQLALPPQQQQVQVQLQQQQQLAPVHLEPSQCLSLEREWDWEKVSSEGLRVCLCFRVPIRLL